LARRPGDGPNNECAVTIHISYTQSCLCFRFRKRKATGADVLDCRQTDKDEECSMPAEQAPSASATIEALQHKLAEKELQVNELQERLKAAE